MQTSPRITKTILRGVTPQARRKREVSAHISHGWCPVNPQIKNRALHLLTEEQVDREAILDELFQDPGLMTHMLKNLSRLLPEQDYIDPVHTLLSIDLGQLKTLLATPERKLSPHRLAKASLKQLAETRHCVEAIQAGITLADQSSCDRYNVAWKTYCNEIGYILAAWNYPMQYSLALGRQRKKGSNLRKELEILLGIELESVFNDYLREWRIKTGVRQSDQGRQQIELEGNLSNLAATWSRAQQPQTFPASVDLLNQLTEELSDTLPADWQELVQHSCETVLEVYKTFEPQIVSKRVNSDVQDESTNQFDELLLKLTPEQKAIIKPVTAAVASGDVRQALVNLINHTAPALGFGNGCLFIQDDQDSPMLPIVRFGDIPLSRYNSDMFDKQGELSGLQNSTVPYKSSGIGMTGKYVDYVISGLTNTELDGVLYLEYQQDDQQLNEHSTHQTFRCLRDVLAVIIQQMTKTS